MKEILGAILNSIVWIMFAGIFLAALVKLQISISLRPFMFAAGYSYLYDVLPSSPNHGANL